MRGCEPVAQSTLNVHLQNHNHGMMSSKLTIRPSLTQTQYREQHSCRCKQTLEPYQPARAVHSRQQPAHKSGQQAAKLASNAGGQKEKGTAQLLNVCTRSGRLSTASAGSDRVLVAHAARLLLHLAAWRQESALSMLPLHACRAGCMYRYRQHWLLVSSAEGLDND